MVISLRDPLLSLEDRMDLAGARARRESMNPPVIGKREFFTKIRAAAREVGIVSPRVYEWDRGLISSHFTDGCLRESQYMLPDKKMQYDSEKDIGYLNHRNHEGLFTVRSFEINPWVFSDVRYQKFQRELEKKGLRPSAHSPLGTVFPAEGEVEQWEKRKPLYR